MHLRPRPENRLPLLTFTHRGNRYSFPPQACGGTPTHPGPKPADELLINWATERPEGPLHIWHDEFGVVTTCLAPSRPTTAHSDNITHLTQTSQALERHGRQATIHSALEGPLNSGPPPLSGLMRLPKYPGLFEYYLASISQHLDPGFALAAAFQTRHFSHSLLEIAQRYAGQVEQSRAYKKARLLLLSHWKQPVDPSALLHELPFGEQGYQQLYGVFSSRHIDYATRFLLEQWPNLHLKVPGGAQNVLDIGCGNGIIGHQLALHHYPHANVAGTDISRVAIKSAQLNNPAGDYRWQSDLEGFPNGSFGLIVTNPPFHEGHRNAIAPTLALFSQAGQKLAPGGQLVVVANHHLNYLTHLQRRFTQAGVLAENRKFVIYSASGPVGKLSLA